MKITSSSFPSSLLLFSFFLSFPFFFFFHQFLWCPEFKRSPRVPRWWSRFGKLAALLCCHSLARRQWIRFKSRRLAGPIEIRAASSGKMCRETLACLAPIFPSQRHNVLSRSWIFEFLPFQTLTGDRFACPTFLPFPFCRRHIARDKFSSFVKRYLYIYISLERIY